MEKFDVVVVGAGITGCATAYALARSGAKVVVIDRYGPAAMASGWTLAGVRQSGRHPAELPLPMAAVKRWQVLHEELDAPTYYKQRGNLRLARNQAEHGPIQAQVLQLLDEIQQETKIAMMFITHDLRVASQICDEIAVMLKGKIVERGTPTEVFRAPKHEYTRRLVSAIPGSEWEPAA